MIIYFILLLKEQTRKMQGFFSLPEKKKMQQINIRNQQSINAAKKKSE
jgi:hypothetical protein